MKLLAKMKVQQPLQCDELMNQSDSDLYAREPDALAQKKITLRKRVILLLVVFTFGFIALLSLQGIFSHFMTELERKEENQRVLIKIGEQIFQDLVRIEKDVYLLYLTDKATIQQQLRSRIYKQLSSIKTKLNVLQWGGAVQQQKANQLIYTPDSSGHIYIDTIVEILPQIALLEDQIAQFSLLLIEHLKNAKTILVVEHRAQLASHLKDIQSTLQQMKERSGDFFSKNHKRLAEFTENIKQQKNTQVGLQLLFSVIFLSVVITLGYRIARQVQEAVSKSVQLGQELQSSRESEQEASKIKATFLSTISHEIRTPINAVVGLTSLLLNTRLAKEQSGYVKSIKESSNHLLSIINDTLDFYKLDTGQVSFDSIDFDLQTVIESIYEIISVRALKKNLKVGYYIQPEVKAVFKGDPARIRQVLINLLNNAVKFTATGGIVLEVTLVVDDTYLQEPKQKPKIRFEVHDSGIGISEQAKRELFKSFTQIDNSLSREFGGTGLGLAIAKHIVELMQGEIGVESVYQQGSLFWFELALEKAALAKQNSDYIEAEKFDQQEILYIDDVELSQRLNIKKMQYWNLQPVAINNTENGIKALWKNKVNGKMNFVVLVDMSTENSEQAIDFVHQVKAEASFKSVPIIFTTSLSFNKIELSLPHYREDLITPLIKPVRNDQLLTALSTALAKLRNAEEQNPLLEQYLLEHKQQQEAPRKVQLNVLVVDDNSINRMVAKGYLKKNGHQIDFANNGKEAVDSVKNNHYDLILMDLQMPVMDGIAATKAIRDLPQADKNSIPIVAMTANAMAEDRKNCYEAGMNDFLSKPIDKTMLEVVLAGNFSNAELSDKAHKKSLGGITNVNDK